MSENISVCGTDCGACSFFGGLCRGCNECQGRVFHAPAGCACSIYACVREKKGLRNCAQCPDLPCSLWQSTRDPSFTDEQFAANIAGRVENLRKRMTNRELADFVSAQLATLPEVRRIPMMGGFIFYYRERIFGGVYGKGFMVKNVPAAWRFMPDTTAEPPYDGARPMLHVPILADSAKLRAMVQAMWEELPERPPKKRKR